MTVFDLFEPDQIIGSTINGWISFPTVFMLMIYLLLGALLLRAYLASRKGQTQNVTKSIAAMIVCAGLLHAVVSDLTWARWVAADVRTFKGLESTQKPAAIDGEIYQFILECRKLVGDNDYTLYPDTSDDDAMRNYFNRKLEYYMLPSRKKPAAVYIIVMFDKAVHYDVATHVFHGSNNELTAATMLLKHGNDAYLLRKQ